MNKIILGFCLGVLFTISIFWIRESRVRNGNVTLPIATTKQSEEKEEKYKILYKLSPEVQISFFENLLGKPTYFNLLNEIEKKEYVFSDPSYFVQALTDKDDKVLTYAIISRKKDFNPTFEMKGFFKVTLNKTPFSEYIPKSEYNPISCYRFQGANTPQYYFEENYFGNPGLYLHNVIGIFLPLVFQRIRM